MDILCQAKSGMGKTAVFVLATLQQIEMVDGEVDKFSSLEQFTPYWFYCIAAFWKGNWFQSLMLPKVILNQFFRPIY